MTMMNQLVNSNKIFLFGFFLLPFLLVTGPFLPDLFLVVSCIYFFFTNGLKILFSRYKKEFIFFLIFFVYLNFNSLLISEHKFISAKVSVPYLRYFIFTFLIIYFLCSYKNFQKIFFYSCLICLCLLFFDSFYQFINKVNILGYPISNNRVSSFFNDEQILGSYTSKIVVIILAISYSLNYKDKTIKYLHFLIFLIGYSLILLSNERTSFAYLLIILSIYCLIELNLKKFFSILSYFLILNLFIYAIYPKTFERIIFHSIDQIKNSKSFLISSYRHDLHYFTAIQMFKDKPIFGHGLKSFRYKCNNPDYEVKKKILNDKAIYADDDGYINFEKDKIFLVKNNNEIFFIGNSYNNISTIKFSNFEKIKKGQYLGSFYEFDNGCNTHPHNTHFQFLSELGLIGYIFLLVTILYLIKDTFKFFKKKFLNKIKLDKSEKSYIICSIGLLLQINPLLPSGSFFNNYNSIIFYMAVAFLIYFKTIKKV
jgi:O-antigen ligase